MHGLSSSLSLPEFARNTWSGSLRSPYSFPQRFTRLLPQQAQCFFSLFITLRLTDCLGIWRSPKATVANCLQFSLCCHGRSYWSGQFSSGKKLLLSRPVLL